MAFIFEFKKEDGTRFLYDFDSDWIIEDNGEDTPAYWYNNKQEKNMDCKNTYEEIKNKMGVGFD